MATMEVSAVQRYVRRAPRKARLVADSVKGMKVTEALAYLEFSPKHAARDVAKAIKSAAANAEHNFRSEARLVADSVKGMKVTEALAYLEFSPKHAARDVAKAIKSAAANAEHNFNLNC